VTLAGAAEIETVIIAAAAEIETAAAAAVAKIDVTEIKNSSEKFLIDFYSRVNFM